MEWEEISKMGELEKDQFKADSSAPPSLPQVPWFFTVCCGESHVFNIDSLFNIFSMTRLLKVSAFKSLSYCGLVRTSRHSVVALVGGNTQRRENHAQTSPVSTFIHIITSLHSSISQFYPYSLFISHRFHPSSHFPQ